MHHQECAQFHRRHQCYPHWRHPRPLHDAITTVITVLMLSCLRTSPVTAILYPLNIILVVRSSASSSCEPCEPSSSESRTYRMVIIIAFGIIMKALALRSAKSSSGALSASLSHRFHRTRSATCILVYLQMFILASLHPESAVHCAWFGARPWLSVWTNQCPLWPLRSEYAPASQRPRGDWKLYAEQVYPMT